MIRFGQLFGQESRLFEAKSFDRVEQACKFQALANRTEIIGEVRAWSLAEIIGEVRV